VSSGSINGKAQATRQLSPAKVTECCTKETYFHCDDIFSLGHTWVCKQLSIIEILGSNDYTVSDIDATDPTISIHVLNGIQHNSK
jgi:hypothetical protein